jgi:hypothetical protein
MQKSIFSTKDFDGLRYPVFTTPIDKIVGLRGLGVERIVRPDKDRLIKYAMSLYDRRSPLIKSFTDISVRKKEAAIAAGYNLDKDSEIIEALYDLSDEDLQMLVIAFLKDQNIRYWTLIVSNEQAFYELNKALLSEVQLGDKGEKDMLQALQIKGKIMDECDKIAERLESYYSKVFGDDDLSNKARQMKKFTPESMAKRDV